MKIRLVWTLSAVLFSAPLLGKPPAAKDAKPAPSPAPTVAPDNDHFNPTAAWLLAQDGGAKSITLPLREVVRAATGKNVLPFDPADSADRAFLARLSGVMDQVLPRINRADSATQAAARLQQATDGIVTQIEVEIAGCYSPVQSGGDLVSGNGYPTFHLSGKDKPYYLTVVFHSPGKEEMASRSLGPAPTFRLDPVEAAGRIRSDGCCLLIGIQYEMKSNGVLAFLNWDVTDVSNVPVRAAVTFQADAADVYHPGAVLTDGRKGSD